MFLIIPHTQLWKLPNPPPPPPQNSLQNIQNFYCSVISKIRPVLWLWFSVLNHLLAVCWWCRWFSEVVLSVKPKPKVALMMSVSQHDNKEATTGNLKTPFQYIYVSCWSGNILQMSNIYFICLHSKWALLCFTFLQWNTSQSRVITFSTSDLGTPRQSSWGAFKEETPNLRSGQETILIVSKGIKNTSSHDTQTSEWLGFFLADCQSYYSTDTEMNNTWENMSYSRILLPN